MSERPAVRHETSASPSTLQVRPYRPGDEVALVEMFSSIFRERSLAEWRWLFLHGPDGPADVGILSSDDRVVGTIAHIPVAVWVGGRRLRLAIGCDLMIVPECRGQGGVEQLMESFFGSEHGFDLNLGSVNPHSGHVLGRHAGTITMGTAPQWIRFQTRGLKLPAILGRALSFGERLYGALASWPTPSLEVTDLTELGPELDELARESAGFAPCIRVRDAAYLRWHWQEQPGAQWRLRGVRGTDGAVHGFAVIGFREEHGQREGTIADLLARDYPTMRALMADAWRCLAADGCSTVTCTYLDPRPWARRVMIRSGFRPMRGPRVASGRLSSLAGAEVEQLAAWYLTYGDIDI